MDYRKIPYTELYDLCTHVFASYGFTKEEAEQITEVLLAADLCGIESHGIQRLVRYHYEITVGMAHPDAVMEVVKETPLSATVDGHNGMGQLIGIKCMNMAIEKAQKYGFGMVTVRGSNHYGIAGYYARMAAEKGLIGMSMTNTEAIMVPTFGRTPMIGTNPIAFAMPAQPLGYCFDGATTVVPRGKLEVYVKRGSELPIGWALDEKGHDSDDADRILKNIIEKTGGGILPIGGFGELTSGYKGYGFGMLCEIATSILSCGTTSPKIYQTPGESGICHCFVALDHGMFGDKAEIEAHLSEYLEEIRRSDKAEGHDRIYIHGEKEAESEARVRTEGVPVNDVTCDELRKIAEYARCKAWLPEELRKPDRNRGERVQEGCGSRTGE